MNILIAIPCYGGNVSNMTFHSLLNTLRWLNDSGHNVRIETLPTESLISRARNKLLADSDYIVLADSNFTPAKKSEWMTYRTALRNLTQGLDTIEKINNVAYPLKPSK